MEDLQRPCWPILAAAHTASAAIRAFNASHLLPHYMLEAMVGAIACPGASYYASIACLDDGRPGLRESCLASCYNCSKRAESG